jgi:hypothetical protein
VNRLRAVLDRLLMRSRVAEEVARVDAMPAAASEQTWTPSGLPVLTSAEARRILAWIEHEHACGEEPR